MITQLLSTTVIVARYIFIHVSPVYFVHRGFRGTSERLRWLVGEGVVAGWPGALVGGAHYENSKDWALMYYIGRSYPMLVCHEKSLQQI